MNETQALQRMEPEHAEIIAHQPLPPPSLFGTADPVEVVVRASRVAASLKEVIKSQGLISRISGKEYPRCEAWTLLGTMLGVYPVLVWTRPMEGGWEARVEARTRDGSIVGAAEAQCLKSERNWGNRDDFALRSMAQTRATAKALRMPLGFVMTLGGFEPTPAEEMTHESTTQTTGAKQPAHAGQQASKPTSPQATQATEDQRQRWLKLLKPIETAALAYAYERGILSGPEEVAGDMMPGEPLELWPLEATPTTKKMADMILGKIRERMDTGTSGPPSTSGGTPKDASRRLPEAATQALDAPSEHPDGVESITGTLEQVSVKEGRSKRGPWKLWGVRIGQDFWANSFDANLGKLAEQDKGSVVTVFYKEGERGNELVGLERADNRD